MRNQAISNLQKLANFYEIGMSTRIKSVKESLSEGRINSSVGMLIDNYRILAMCAKYLEGDDVEFRQHMHVACRINLASLRLDDTERFGTGSDVFDALLSDSREVIQGMVEYVPRFYGPLREDPLQSQFLVHMWQLAIAGNYEYLESKISKMASNGRKPLRTQCAQKRDFFSLLMQRDIAGLKARIQEDAKLPNDDPITADFFTYLATFETKLCWYKGIEVHIDDPRVPMDLMPVRPLAHYDDVYDFLKPDWIPPRPGVLGRLARLVGR